MNFDVIGPFEIKRNGAKNIINKRSLDDFKEQLEAKEEGLSTSCGCYVFAKRAGQGCKPWYVGQACKSPMANEALNAENRGKYNDLDSKGTPVIFVVPARTPGGKLRKRPSQPLASLNFLEKWLIAAAIERNPDLINSKETKFLRDLHVVGLLNAKKGESNGSSQALSKTLFG
ncbi:MULTISPECIES: hypothetical protein [unclassified Halorhodospira]|uniref:hypothetical protein n=1 Tax=unclassified Halorhodospira TaxID=2626748 RepID=UPI001EE824F4|nr:MULTISPECIES: hypothetical protein [unclassified Halorhodospira]MCG5539868.1 hypothetical protein [Halorhodospira sp. M39old]MCG5544681.1 hypothetical protein [Halorhodospira sp. M38]